MLLKPPKLELHCEELFSILFAVGDNSRMIESTKGTPTNTIHGTKVSVKIQVRMYNGKTDSASPNK